MKKQIYYFQISGKKPKKFRTHDKMTGFSWLLKCDQAESLNHMYFLYTTAKESQAKAARPALHSSGAM